MYRYFVFLISFGIRKTKNDILNRFSNSACTKKNEIRQYGSFFVFRIPHCIRNEKNEWRHCRLSLLPYRKCGIRKMDPDVTYSVALLRFFLKSYIILCVAVVTLWVTPTSGVGVFEGSGGPALEAVFRFPSGVQSRGVASVRACQQVTNYNLKFDHI